MESAALLLLYGLSAWGAALNFPAWGQLFWRRLRDPARQRWWRDNLLLVRAGLTTLSFGIMGLAGVRLLGAIWEGVPIEVPSTIGVAFIGCMAAAEPMFLRVDEIHAQARGKRSVAWRLYWAGAISGCALFVIALLTGAWR